MASGLTVRLPIQSSLDQAAERAKSYDTIRLGRIAEGDIVQGTFRVENKSVDRPLVIVQVITGCGCATVDYDAKPIPAGESREIKYQFDSRGRYGQQFKSIEIITAEREVATVYLESEVYTSGN